MPPPILWDNCDVHFPTCQSDATQSALRPGAVLRDEITGTKFVFADSPELGSRAPDGLGRRSASGES